MAASNHLSGTTAPPAPPAAAESAARLRTAVARIDRLLSRQVLGSTLTRTQFSVLGVLARSGEQRLADLLEREGLNPSMLSRVVGALEREGWVDRAADPADRRAARVAITPAGAALHQRLRRERSALVEDWLAGLDGAAERRLTAALPLLEDLAEQLRQQPGGGPAAAQDAGRGARRVPRWAR